MSTPITDIKTTPRWMQPIALFMVLAFAAYFLIAFWPPYGMKTPPWVSFGRWRMFTSKVTTHVGIEVRAIASPGAPPTKVDVDAMFPYRWGSGPRHQYPWFRKRGSALRMLSEATCKRIEPTPYQMTVVEQRWRMTPGRYVQPKRKVKEKVLLNWRCGSPLRMPPGEVW